MTHPAREDDVMPTTTRDAVPGFGPAVRAAREAKGWTQRELAAAAGLHPNAVALAERGERAPSLRTALLLARPLGLSLDSLQPPASSE